MPRSASTARGTRTWPDVSGQQSAWGQWQVWDFGQLHQGVAFTLFMAWQANSTNPGRHAQDTALYDGSTRLMIVHRALTVFP